MALNIKKLVGIGTTTVASNKKKQLYFVNIIIDIEYM